MKILLIAEYVRDNPITIGYWLIDLARALAARGHTVTVALDGLENAEPLMQIGAAPHDTSTPIDLRVHRPGRDHLGANPFAFQAWAMRMRDQITHDVSLSLTPLVPGDVWLPLGPQTWDSIKSVLMTQSPISAVSEFVHRPWLPAVDVAERLAARATTRRLTFGLQGIGYASRLDQPDEDRIADVRRVVRRRLGIDESRSVVIASVLHAHRSGLKSFLGAFGHVVRETIGPKPLALLIGRSGESIARYADRFGVTEHVLQLGRTMRVMELIAASDLVAAPLAAAKYASWGLKQSSTSGRFVADGLRIGRPVIALNRASGAELLTPGRVEGDPLGPGWIVDANDTTQWSIGLMTGLSRAWLGHRTDAARRAGQDLGMDHLMERLEALLSATRSSARSSGLLSAEKQNAPA